MITFLSEEDCAITGTVRIVNVLEAPNTQKEPMLSFSDREKKITGF